MEALLAGLMAWLLLRSETAMDAAAEAARLFVAGVLPGLFPYMTLALLAFSRLRGDMPNRLLILAGWCGGSPTGARLLAQRPPQNAHARRRIAVASATMSPMFLLGTVPRWTGSALSGVVILGATLLSGAILGALAGGRGAGNGRAPEQRTANAPLSLGEAVDAAARTMLLVCGTMMLLRVLAALAGEVLGGGTPAALALTTLLEVTSGVSALASLPLPLALRTALIAGAVSFGGASVILQNHALYPPDTLSLPRQLVWQLAHAALAFLIALGAMRAIS